MALLEVRAITKAFGGVVALNGCSMTLEPNRVYGLIGPNGSGKTTLFNVITGLTKPNSGKIVHKGEDITGLKPHEIARRGIARTFQLTRIFTKMTVLENLLTVAPRKRIEGEYGQKLLEIIGLKDLEDGVAGNLSYGQRKQLEVARIVLMDPDLIMLDEPMAGLTASMIGKILDEIEYAKDSGKTVIIVEHNLAVIMHVCEQIFVLDHGYKIAEGSPPEIQKDELVTKAYLGDA